jgi:hypothetical protein
MIVIACGGLIGAVFVVLFRAWYARRSPPDEDASAGTATA